MSVFFIKDLRRELVAIAPTSKIPPHLPRNGAARAVDKDWVRTSFMLPIVPGNPTLGKLNQDDRQWLYYTSASKKFTTTGLGGNFCINPPPKYTRFADIPTGAWVQGIANSEAIKTNSPLRDRMDIGGMGRYYSEAIDDNATTIHMRFGRPEYKGLITFFTGFYDVDASRLAREGRGSNIPFLAGKLLGTVVGIGLLPVILLYKLGKLLLSRPSTKYYNSRPSMPLYWTRVNFIANKIAMTKGIIPKGTVFERERRQKFYVEKGMEARGLEERDIPFQYEKLQQWRKNWFTGDSKWGGGLDIQYIVARPTVIQQDTLEKLIQVTASCNSPAEIEKKVLDFLSSNTGYDKRVKVSTTAEYLNEYFKSRFGSLDYSKPDPYAEEVKNSINQARTEWGLAGGPDTPQVNADGSVTTSGNTTGQSQTQQAAAATQRVNTRLGGGAGGTGIFSTGISSNLTAEETPAAPGGSANASADANNGKRQVNTNVTAAAGSASSTTGANYGGGDEYDQLAAKYASYDGQIFPVFVPDVDEKTGQPSIKRSQSYADASNVIDFIEQRLHHSLEWLILNVNPVTEVSESFSNNTSQSEIQNKINGIAAANQAARFSLSDFNTGFSVIDNVIDVVKSTISGVASGVMLDGLVAMTGTAFVDIPERWDSSSADISASATYTMQLRSPYGNPLSQFLNIDVPLACLLAAALPISHGNQSYGEPFLVELYSPGKNVIRLGMISSLSITRGTGTVGWTQSGSPIGVDVSFTVKDLSTAVHAPIDTDMHSLLPWRGLMASDNTFHDYMAVLGNMSINDMTSNENRIAMNISQKISNYKRLVSPQNIANIILDNGAGRNVMRITQELGYANASIK